MENFNSLSLNAVLAHGALAFFGGITHALNAHRHGKTKNIGDVGILAIISSFSGIIFALVALYLFDNTYITLAAAGSGGYLGTEGLSVVAEKVRDMLTKRTP